MLSWKRNRFEILISDEQSHLNLKVFSDLVRQ